MRILTAVLTVIAMASATSAAATVYTGTLLPPSGGSIYEAISDVSATYQVSFQSSEPLMYSELDFGTIFTDILFNDDGTIFDYDTQNENFIDFPLTVDTPTLLVGQYTSPTAMNYYYPDGNVYEEQFYSCDNFTETATVASPANYVFTISVVPEPTTWALMLVGVFGVGALTRRRASAAATPGIEFGAHMGKRTLDPLLIPPRTISL